MSDQQISDGKRSTTGTGWMLWCQQAEIERDELMTTTASPRPVTQVQRLAALELLRLAMTTPSEVADVFVTWHPHVNGITVTINDGGWKDPRDGEDPPKEFAETAYLDRRDEDQLQSLVANVKEHLAKLAPNQIQQPEPPAIQHEHEWEYRGGGDHDYCRICNLERQRGSL